MSVCLPPRKTTVVKQPCDINLLQQGKPTIREACSGRLIRVQFGELHHRCFNRME